jgi:hypothetical protein
MEIWDDEVVFINKHGEQLEETLYPQFPDVSAEVINTVTGKSLAPPIHKRPVVKTSTTRQFSTAKRPKHPSLFRDHTEKELVDMIHFREEWGTRKDERFWKQILGSDLPG